MFGIDDNVKREKCNDPHYNYNRTGGFRSVFKGFEGIPENLLLNFIVWLVSVFFSSSNHSLLNGLIDCTRSRIKTLSLYSSNTIYICL